MALSTKQLEILRKITRLLEENVICYQVTGGTAAILWGVDRDTQDLDFDVSKKDIAKIREIFGKYITTDYHQYIGADFDLWLVICEIEGVPVEFGQSEGAMILGIGNKVWTPLPDTIKNARIVEIDGDEVRLQATGDLIQYKEILGRDVDILDVKQLSKLL